MRIPLFCLDDNMQPFLRFLVINGSGIICQYTATIVKNQLCMITTSNSRGAAFSWRQELVSLVCVLEVAQAYALIQPIQLWSITVARTSSIDFRLEQQQKMLSRNELIVVEVGDKCQTVTPSPRFSCLDFGHMASDRRNPRTYVQGLHGLGSASFNPACQRLLQ